MGSYSYDFIVSVNHDWTGDGEYKGLNNFKHIVQIMIENSKLRKDSLIKNFIFHDSDEINTHIWIKRKIREAIDEFYDLFLLETGNILM